MRLRRKKDLLLKNPDEFAVTEERYSKHQRKLYTLRFFSSPQRRSPLICFFSLRFCEAAEVYNLEVFKWCLGNGNDNTLKIAYNCQ